MTVGFVVTFFDFRNDVRRVVECVAQDHEVILFCQRKDREQVQTHAPAGTEIRLIKEEGHRFSDRLTRLKYRLRRAIPASTQNFYLMEAFKIGRMQGRNKRMGQAFYDLHRLLPNRYTYDQYLDDIRPLRQTDVSGVDAFVCFSEIADDAFLSRLINDGLPVLTYVYSWDHPCKHTRFSVRSQNLVWNQGLADDLHELQNVPRSNISVVGASQFCYVHEYLTEYRQTVTDKIFDFPYVYMGCAIGIESLVPDEVDVACELADVVARETPGLKLVVRPYPPLRNWSLYDRLYAHPAIVVDDDFRSKDRSVGQRALMEKFIKLDQAEGFFHLGTTLGLECCFTSTPSFMLDVRPDDGQAVNVYNFVHQYQNDKYLADAAPVNHALGWEKVGQILRRVGDPKYTELNALVQSQNNVQSFSSFTGALLAELKQLKQPTK